MHPVAWLPRQEASSNKVEDSVWLVFFAGEVPACWMAGIFPAKVSKPKTAEKWKSLEKMASTERWHVYMSRNVQSKHRMFHGILLLRKSQLFWGARRRLAGATGLLRGLTTKWLFIKTEGVGFWCIKTWQRGQALGSLGWSMEEDALEEAWPLLMF